MPDTARITQSSTGKYDQVIAVTQYILNNGLDNLYLKVQEEHPTDLQSQINGSNGSSIHDLTLGSPRVIVDPSSPSKQSLLYQMRLTSGSLTLKTSTDSSDKSKVCYNISDWKFVFPVNMGLEGLKESDTDYKKIKDLINKPGDYTISQLFVDLSSARFDQPDATLSSYGTWASEDYVLDRNGNKQKPPNFKEGGARDWQKETPETRSSFNTLMRDCKEAISNAGLANLGFVAVSKAHATGDAQHEPTFLPTSVRTQTYPWISQQAGKPPIGLQGDARFNYLLYMEMTDAAPPPPISSQDAWLQIWNGNWTDGEDPKRDPPSKFATFLLSHEKFLEQYIFPKLNRLNRCMTWEMTEPHAEMHAKGRSSNWSWYWTVTVGAGFERDPTGQGDAPFAYTKGEPAGPKDFKWAGLPSNALVWSYTRPYVKKEKYADDRGVLLHPEIWVDGSSSAGIRLSIIPGTNRILLEGRIILDFNMKVDPGGLSHTQSERDHLQLDWSVVMTLQEVSDGGLQIGVEAFGPTVHWTGDISKSQELKDQTNKAVADCHQNLLAVTTRLRNSLQGQERFYFPSRGTFFFKNPIFNHRGDLLSEISYNDNEKLGVINPRTPQRDTSKPIDFAPGHNISSGK